MADQKINLGPIRALADLAIEKGLTELEYETGKLRIRIVRAGGIVSASAAQVAVPAAAPGAEAPAPEAAEPPEDEHVVESPMVGTFYVAPAPGAASFVEVGDRVKAGQVVCIIEAMKLMNEIEAEIGGVIVERLVENGQGVEFGQPLFRVKAS